ncbi:glycoside hydrolase superfamily [Zychaea mexicana]|uniref:glycoside hydrolase superfamily n=1 Tax=Zychaea mexicana TaxID=64656 RepID=UPI0022FF1BE1|nr:glycoside hydrolase superfamily [Zychaea mexicana]KAI9484800.1 glycoside hydrolase superfamily [Zychaea mexicana]
MASALLAAPSLVSAFVGTSGATFTNDGASFYFAGTNAYYLMTQTQENVQSILSESAGLNLPVIRTWLFNSGNTDVFFQSCNSGAMEINDDAETGLGRIDYVIQQAAENNVKLIFALTNNWPDFGGMDDYVQCLGGSNHDEFYTNADVVNSFKEYITHVLERTNELTGVKYKDDPTIFGWELANEPRCGGSGLPTSDSCGPDITTAWVDEISSHIKSIDSNHLVGIGDEGFFNRAGESEYEYNGGTGMDFDATIALSSIDFGTFHMYPEHWTKDNEEWPIKWINDHAASQESAGKPVILEEYGLAEKSLRTTLYPAWHAAIEEQNVAADAFWQISVPCNENLDDFAICPSDENIDTLVATHASNMLAKN